MRPSSYTDETAKDICEQLAKGKSLRAICKAEGMPDKATVFRWLEANESFRDQYARAREQQAEHYLDEIIEISDDVTRDLTENASGDNVVNQEAIQRARLRVDTRKWVMSKLAPKKYGDKLDLNHSGKVAFTKQDVSDDELAAIARGGSSGAVGPSAGTD